MIKTPQLDDPTISSKLDPVGISATKLTVFSRINEIQAERGRVLLEKPFPGVGTPLSDDAAISRRPDSGSPMVAMLMSGPTDQ